MALRKIVVQGEDCLNKVCRPVTDFNRRLHALMDAVRVVMDDDTEEYIELINPAIVAQSGEQTGPEGCLSVPGKWGLVTRPNYVRVRAQDRDGNWFEVEGEGLTARCFCHELEHLDGHLYTEHIERFLTDEEVEEYFSQEEGAD